MKTEDDPGDVTRPGESKNLNGHHTLEQVSMHTSLGPVMGLARSAALATDFGFCSAFATAEACFGSVFGTAEPELRATAAAAAAAAPCDCSALMAAIFPEYKLCSYKFPGRMWSSARVI